MTIINIDEPVLTVVEVAKLMRLTPKACLEVLARNGVEIDESRKPRRVWLSHLFERLPHLRESLLLLVEMRKLRE